MAPTIINQSEFNSPSQEISLEHYGDYDCASFSDEDSDVFLLPSQSTQPSKHNRTALRRLSESLGWCKLTDITFRKADIIRRLRLSTLLSRLLRFAYSFTGFLLALIIFVGTFLPSYTQLPPHYASLRDRVSHGWEDGSGNINQEKVFIAATIFDPRGELARGSWAEDLIRLIHILGPSNVYLSIYENDAGATALEALSILEQRVPCNHTLIFDERLEIEKFPKIQLPDGTFRIKRIAYLAEVRNRALRPLETSSLRFDKLLYLNDVIFDPVEAAQLLFSTNIDRTGKAQYRSACAVDFVNPFKFYDTFATRDLDGYSMGVPFFPWFSAGGGYKSLQDVLGQRDAVRVRSCWGGMVAFDAGFFQNWSDEAINILTAANTGPANKTAPYRFRAGDDVWWDSSECCLIQADIQNPDTSNTEIYMNPFVRVAYNTRTLSWLWLTKRFEKLYVPVHLIADYLVSLPSFNPRRHEVPWQLVEEVVWISDNTTAAPGSWRNVLRTAQHDGYCGRRALPVMKQSMYSSGRNYEFIEPPQQVA